MLHSAAEHSVSSPPLTEAGKVPFQGDNVGKGHICACCRVGGALPPCLPHPVFANSLKTNPRQLGQKCFSSSMCRIAECGGVYSCQMTPVCVLGWGGHRGIAPPFPTTAVQIFWDKGLGLPDSHSHKAIAVAADRLSFSPWVVFRTFSLCLQGWGVRGGGQGAHRTLCYFFPPVLATCIVTLSGILLPPASSTISPCSSGVCLRGLGLGEGKFCSPSHSPLRFHL